MSRGNAIILGVFTAWPFLYMLLFMGTMFVAFMGGGFGGGPGAGEPLAFRIIFPVHMLTMLEIFVLLVVYIVHLFGTDRVPQDKKALWAVVLFLGHMIAMPVFWYLYIWREPDAETPERPGQGGR